MEDLVDADLAETGGIFTELAGELRRSILYLLGEKSLKLSQLAKELDTTIQHAHININRLINVGFVEKDSKGSLSLTTYGRTVLRQMPTFQFLTKYKDYFSEHTLGNLPLKFERRIGDLNNCTLIKGVAPVLQRWKVMYQSAGGYINTITSQILVDLIEPLAQKVRNGTKLSYIMPEDVIVPKGTLETVKKVSWSSLLAEGKAERRMTKKVLVSIIVTDKAVGVLFPNLKNEVDMNLMFYSEDETFGEWCQDYFRYMWDSSDIFDRRKLEREI
jgi:predicted transcriptional regulator